MNQRTAGFNKAYHPLLKDNKKQAFSLFHLWMLGYNAHGHIHFYFRSYNSHSFYIFPNNHIADVIPLFSSVLSFETEFYTSPFQQWVYYQWLSRRIYKSTNVDSPESLTKVGTARLLICGLSYSFNTTQLYRRELHPLHFTIASDYGFFMDWD